MVGPAQQLCSFCSQVNTIQPSRHSSPTPTYFYYTGNQSQKENKESKKCRYIVYYVANDNGIMIYGKLMTATATASASVGIGDNQQSSSNDNETVTFDLIVIACGLHQ